MPETPEKKPTLSQVIMSVLAAMFGVQSDNVRRRDFTHGNPLAFIIVGIVLCILFVLMIYGVVSWVMAGVGK
ncbi:MAG: hypothetical protein BGO43_02905 [Gammaproteobacteria bacterium 39-13]|nr:DUF2970 domain-containing protein [Gammaproteobacteria bacterium]OJV85652.1 MAG: hypothetical protein BGO43_02905 [Gammaproteobacteria bacterium 39-13]